jgi:uncharacterized DUF497 family protein
MKIRWLERKRASNLKDLGFDFADAHLVFEGLTVTREDDRFSYHEQRLQTIGLTRDVVVSITHTESDN